MQRPCCLTHCTNKQQLMLLATPETAMQLDARRSTRSALVSTLDHDACIASGQNPALVASHLAGSQHSTAEAAAGASKHLWLGNLNTRLPRAVLKSVFERHGPVEDVVTFPGRMYAFVNFQHSEDAARAQEALDGKEVSSA